MTESTREARRRRILERGSDRLALVSGQVKYLPADPVRSNNAPSSPSVNQAQSPPPHPQTLDSQQSEDKATGALSPKQDTVPETSREEVTVADVAEPIISNPDSSAEPSHVSSRDLDGRASSDEVPSRIRSPRDSTSPKDKLFKQLAHLCNSDTINEVKSAISASASIRSLCSAIVAILVVLAHAGFPILRSGLVKRVIFFRPLYFLILTNVTLVVARVLEKQRGTRKPELQATRDPSGEEPDLFDQLGTFMELAFLLQNVMGALFMDCSIYAVTLVCGFSLAQCFGW